MREFSNIQKLLQKTTAKRKPMTYCLSYRNQSVVVKRVEHVKSMYDYIIVNECKPIFNMHRIENLRIFKSTYDIDERTNEVCQCSRVQCFYIMNFIANSAMISDSIDVLADPSILQQYVRCAVYRGIFRVTDFCSRNILISGDKLYSIDENAIGTQYEVIKKRDMNKYLKSFDKIELRRILDEMMHDFKGKLAKIKAVLMKYHKEELFRLIEYHFKFIARDCLRDIQLT